MKNSMPTGKPPKPMGSKDPMSSKPTTYLESASEQIRYADNKAIANANTAMANMVKGKK